MDHPTARRTEDSSMTFDDIPGFSEGHKRCMRVILDKAGEISRPFKVIPVVIGEGGHGSF